MSNAALQDHPHARAVLGAALERPSHAYLLGGPAGSGKRAAARALASELLSRGAPDPAAVRARIENGAHPDLTWVAPSGAHEMLRRDVEQAVVASAARTPFEAQYRIFVLERAETMNDEAANALLKTLEEPPSFVMVLLLSDRPTKVLPTIASRCQPVRFEAPAPDALAAQVAQRAGIADGDRAQAVARLALGDGERADRIASGHGGDLRAAAERFVHAVLDREVGTETPWSDLLELAASAGVRARGAIEARLADELALLPCKEHKRREDELGEQAKRADRRAQTATLDLGLALVGLWFRDLVCVALGAPELIHNRDRTDDLPPARNSVDALCRAIELVDDTRAALAVNVSYDLACEALAFRLEALLDDARSVA